MKRPPGVTPPPPGSERKQHESGPPAAERPPVPRVKTPRTGSSSEPPWWTRKKSEAVSGADVEQLTEPIPFVKPESPVAKSGGPVAKPQSSVVKPQSPVVKPGPLATPDNPFLKPGALVTPDEESPGRLSLKEAERRRKRYERAEARRFTKRSRVRRRNLLIGAGIVAVVVVLAVLTAYSPLLTLRTITVEGASRVDAAAVTASLDDQLGKPLSLVDFGRVQTELRAYPLIQSYVTETRPPDTLVVRIVERQPVASVATKSGFDLVDPAGVVIQETPDAPPGYPAIDTNSTKLGTPGFAEIGKALLALPPDFRSQISLIGAATPDSITMLLTTGEHVVWGSADQSPLKARILKALIAQPDLDTSSVDVSSPEAPVTGP